jgi:hypothetical protein
VTEQLLGPLYSAENIQPEETGTNYISSGEYTMALTLPFAAKAGVGGGGGWFRGKIFALRKI